jgi:aspartyl-tRNA(Asn)/glutamyl-tRNA(Gln) amidotransferase subunit A
LLDLGLLEVTARAGATAATEFLEADALRLLAGHTMARFHQRYDLVICPTVPNPPMPADAPTTDPMEALWTQWAPWTFTFNLTRQPAITVPMGIGENGLPLSVQIAAAQFRDDLVYRAARAIEIQQPFPMPEI